MISSTPASHPITEAAFSELLASCEAALETANRSASIARALAEGYRSGVRPPDVVLEAYFATFERDEIQLSELREKVRQLKTHPTRVDTA